ARAGAQRREASSAAQAERRTHSRELSRPDHSADLGRGRRRGSAATAAGRERGSNSRVPGRPANRTRRERSMTPADEEKFASILMGMSAVLPGGKLTKQAVRLYWLAMQDWSIEDFERAAIHLLREETFMPGPNKFHKLRKAGE